MSDFSTAIDTIKSSTNLDQIREVVSEFSAAGTGKGGVLYSGRVGGIPASKVAIQLAKENGLSVIDNTACGLLLNNQTVVDAVAKQAVSIFTKSGMTAGAAEKAAA
jgi:hypothetical protein